MTVGHSFFLFLFAKYINKIRPVVKVRAVDKDLHMHQKLARVSLRTSFSYWLIAVSWILLSDQILHTITSDIGLIKTIEIYKGWAFVTVTAVGLYFTLRKQLFQVEKETESRRLTEVALLESQQNFQRLTESLPQLIWTCDSNGMADYFAPQWQIYTGQPAAEQMGMKWLDQIHPDDKARLSKAWYEAVATGQNYENEYRIRRHDGVYRWFFTRAVPLRDAAGNIVKWFGTNTDIQAQRELREELRLREEHLRLATEAAQMGTWERDLQSNKLFWSPALEKLMGFEPGKFPGTIDALVKLIAPEDLKNFTAARKAASQNRGKYQVELRYLLPNGRDRYAFVSGQTIFDETGTPTRIVGVDWDITKRKKIEQALRESEMRLRLALDAGQMGVWSWNPITDVVEVDEIYLQLYGLTKENFKGTSAEFFTLVHPDDAATIKSLLIKAVQEHTTYEAEFRIIHPDQSVRWVHGNGKGLYNQENILQAFIGVSYDVTARKEAEEALRREQSQLQAVFQSIEDGIAVTDMEGSFLMVNEAEARINGFDSIEEMKQRLEFYRKIYQLYHPNGDVLPFEEWPLKRILQGEAISQLEFRVKRLDTGKECFFSFSGTPVYDENGQQILAVVSNRDISERKKAEQELYDQKAQLEAVFQSIQEGLIVTDVEGNIRLFNEAQLRTFEIPSLEAIQIYRTTYLQHFEFKDSQGEIISVDNWPTPRVLRGETFTDWELHGKNLQTGKEGFYSFSGVPVYDAQGKQILAVVSNRDITERKHAEQELQRQKAQLEGVFNSSQEGIAVLELKSDSILINEVSAQILGFSSSQELDETLPYLQDMFELSHLNGTKLSSEEWPLPKLRRGETFKDWEVRCRRHDNGKEWIFNLNGGPVYDAQGQQILAVLSSRDITESKRAEMALHESEARLRLLSDISRNFAEAGPDFNSVRKQVVQSITTTLDDYCAICLFSEEGKRLQSTGMFHPDPELQEFLTQINNDEPYDLCDAPIDRSVYETKEAAFIPEVQYQQLASSVHKRYLPILDRISFQSFIMAPMRNEGTVLGLVCVGRTRTGLKPFDKNDLQFIQEISDRAALALRNAQLYEEVQKELVIRQTTELTLRKEQERLAATAATSPGVLYSFQQSAHGTYTLPYAAPGLTRIFETDIAILDKDSSPLFSLLHPDDLPRINETIAESVQTMSPWRQSFRVQNPTLGERWVEAHSTPLRESDGSIIWHGVMIDITERKQAEEKLLQSYEQLRELTQKLQTIREEERRYLARELHDEIGQLMTGLKYLLEIIGLATEAQNLKQVTEAQDLANSVLLKVRQLSLDLRPGVLDDLGLVPALLWHFNRFREQTDIAVQLTHAGIEGKRFDREVETTVYRIIQEALTNIARHANCKEAAVQIWTDDKQIHIQIEDQGRGFNAIAATESRDSSGLAGMRERATILGGTLVVESEPDCGTTIFSTIPLR